jgi:hypothetical protein
MTHARNHGEQAVQDPCTSKGDVVHQRAKMVMFKPRKLCPDWIVESAINDIDTADGQAHRSALSLTR